MCYLSEKSCCITDHFTKKNGYTQDRLAYLLYEEVYRAVGEGYDTFYFGGVSEIGIIAAEQVLLRRIVIQKGDPKHIHLIAVLPYDHQANNLELSWQERYYYILSRCDEVITLHSHIKEAYVRYMIDRCSRVIAVYNKLSQSGMNYALAYAESKGINIATVPLDG